MTFAPYLDNCGTVSPSEDPHICADSGYSLDSISKEGVQLCVCLHVAVRLCVREKERQAGILQPCSATLE